MKNSTSTKNRVHLALFYSEQFNIVNWSHPNSQVLSDFSSHRHAIKSAERGLFDAFFYGESLRFQEHLGRPDHVNIYGQPEKINHLSALAAETEHIGLVATQNSSYNEPIDLARRLSTLHHLSGGRAGWNVVTTDDEWASASYRKSGYLPHEARYDRARATLDAVRAQWALADLDQTHSLSLNSSSHFSVDTASPFLTARTPATTLGFNELDRPAIFQAGISEVGQQFAVETADAIFTPFADETPIRTFSEGIRQKLKKTGRDPNSILIFSHGYMIVGETKEDAQEQARIHREFTMRDNVLVQSVEKIWGRALTDLDLDGTLPPLSDLVDRSKDLNFNPKRFKLRSQSEVAEEWVKISKDKNFSVRELLEFLNPERAYIGTGDEIAERFIDLVDKGITDGFMIHQLIQPTDVDNLVKYLVPALQERGAYPEEYKGGTILENLFG